MIAVVIVVLLTLLTFAILFLLIVIPPNIKKVDVTNYRGALEQTSDPQDIPRIIVQTHEYSLIPIGMKNAMDGILNANKEYEYRYFNNEDAREFISKNFPMNVRKAYDKLIPGAYRADLFRCCFLYIHGGVYMDTGFESITPLREFIKPTDKLILVKDRPEFAIYNAFIASIPKHPFFLECIHSIVKNVESNYYGMDALAPTGPRLVGKVFCHHFNVKKIPVGYLTNDVHVLRHRKGGVYLEQNKLFNTKYRGALYEAAFNTTHYSVLWTTRQIYKK